jgi:aspartate dehydrogenase
MMVRVGLAGCGTIGTQLALTLQRHYPHAARLTALHDADPRSALTLQRRLHPAPPIVSLPQLIRRSDLILEAASPALAATLVPRALRAGRSVFVMSVGALVLDRRWQRWARQPRALVHIPSGALAGLDGVKALAVGRVRRLTLTTRKPPRALAQAPYVRARGWVLAHLRRPRVLFEGSPRQVVRHFPQNTNVAAALMLAGGRAGARVRVRVVADPRLSRNVHELEVVGDCGRVQCRVESRPSRNPKTSELAVRSAVAALGRLFDAIQIGT